ncbi:MAG: SDR family NAD(P)-dependent oxidoreductase [Acidobacteriota bacterium]
MAEAKVVLITGAGGALGGTVAEAFRADSRLALTDRRMDRLESAYGSWPNTLLASCELDAAVEVEGLIAKVVERFGRLDVLVNVAGGFRGGKVAHEAPADELATLLAINTTSVWNACRAAVPAMLRQGSGKIVTIASLNALAGSANVAAYSAAKAATLRLCESVSAEVKEHGVNVNCVLPGTMNTPANRAAMPDTDPRQWVDPRAVAQVVRFLASDAAGAVHGVAIPVTGHS